ncbi:extracellular solute-binding protein [Clostridium thermosuccinogenes]|uniref:extracellular solute-binding protein n=1 Tax=Clostridium thermosuccinogenes TaxID=84032 RepID=UPI000CCC1D20|nr:extracellular solute-binding protein [Pseudoclostridium thermosuccinogenes]PNT92653.1 ABC transporter substrate-binding protein [Pseudoclostridium thermosuccinogenes]
MKKLSKKLIALLTVASMLFMVACSSGSSNSDSSSDTKGSATDTTSSSGGDKTADAKPLKFTATLTGWGGDDANSMVHKEWLKVMEEKMGRPLDITFNWIPQAEYEEKSKLMFSTGDLTDITVTPFWYDYVKVAKDGLLLELSQYKDLLPNYMEWVKATKDGEALCFLPDGTMYVFMQGELPRFPADKGMLAQNMSAYNYNVFEKHNIKIPETLDELYVAAKKLKELYPNEYPINTRFQSLNPIFYAHHVDRDVYWNGEEYVYGPFEEGYKESLMFLNKLYTEGLLDPEYSIETNDTIKMKALNQKNFIFLNEWFTSPGEYSRNNEEGLKFAVTLYPDNPKYGKCWQTVSNVNTMNLSNWGMFAIDAKTKDPEGLMKFIDLQYSEEIIRLLTWGIEGVTYTIGPDGKPQFVDSILNAKDPWAEGDKYGMRASSKHRPGLQMAADTAAYVAFAPNDYIYYDGKLHEEPIEKSPYITEIPFPENEYMPPWFNGPTVTFTTEENQEISKIKTALDTYRDEMQTKFISGEESFANWDKFINGLKSMGDIDRLLEIYNAAADRFYGK